MLSPKLRNDIFELWTLFWSSGMTNPLTAIEQITYLLFLKRLEDLDGQRVLQGKRSIYAPRPNCNLPHHPDDGKGVNEPLPGCPGHQTCRWKYILQAFPVNDLKTNEPITPHDHLSQYVFPWLRVLEKTLKETNNEANGLEATAKRMEDAYFQLPREKTATLQKAIGTIDRLFNQSDNTDDLMGDIFEYLLSEIQTSGKNGQFRTPRHIIRFMIELLNPDYYESVADPAAGTAGFLINTIQHVLKRYTDPRTVVQEWDGTPHRLNGAMLPPTVTYPSSNLFTGYDNDRTMVRIGWMNLILHGLEDPNIALQDALGTSLKETGEYDVILANPPFTGTVDKDDLNESLKDLGTNKSELLFVQTILNLLKVGGRAAVIVPEGVLFGSTNAHKELRRRLLLDNQLEGVVSLPAGIFQPYTGVKTSVLIFRKIHQRCLAGMEPQTKEVWFYDVAADGHTLDAKRTPRPDPNDLWDAIEKWRNRELQSSDYYQPNYETVRWRLVDDKTIQLFAEAIPQIAKEKDKVRSIDELFPTLADSRDPRVITENIKGQQRPRMYTLYEDCLNAIETSLIAFPRTQKETKNALDTSAREINRMFDDARRDMLEHGNGLPTYGRKALDPILTEVRKTLEEDIEKRTKRILQETSSKLAEAGTGESLRSEEIQRRWRPGIEAIVRDFAKLDGYDVMLRSHGLEKRGIEESKHWTVPLRVFARRDDWISADGTIQGSHNSEGRPRPQFIADTRIYKSDGTVYKDYLDPDCIEYNDLNLSAGRYKPFSLATIEYDPPAQIIRELQALETQIQEGLANLLVMVEGEE